MQDIATVNKDKYKAVIKHNYDDGHISLKSIYAFIIHFIDNACADIWN